MYLSIDVSKPYIENPGNAPDSISEKRESVAAIHRRPALARKSAKMNRM
jgi:hypothetical protein